MRPSELADRVRWKLAQRHARPGRYDPKRFWQARATELIHRYDDTSSSWGRRGWMEGGVEEELVPRWLRELGCASVLVAGAGSGRQYAYLLAEGFDVEGFDIAPRLVRECRRRFPEVRTTEASVVDAPRSHEPADAVLCSGVLQHVPPEEIGQALDALTALARKAIVLRELTTLDVASAYQWAHDYRSLLGGWREARAEATDERVGMRVELMAFVRPL